MSDDTYMRRGKSQVLFNYLPGNTFDYAGQDGIHKVVSIDATVGGDFNEQYLGTQILNRVRARDAANGYGAVGFPRYPDNFQFLRPQEVETGLFPLLFRCTTCERIQTYDDVAELERYNSDMECRHDDCAGDIQQHQFVFIHECGEIQTPRPGRCDGCGNYDHWTFETYGSQRFRNVEWRCTDCGNTDDIQAWCNCDLPNSRMQLTVHRASSAYQVQHISVIDISADVAADASRAAFAQAVAARFLDLTDESIEDIDLEREQTNERREELEWQLEQYEEMYEQSGAAELREQIDEIERELEELEDEDGSLADEVADYVPSLDVDPTDSDDEIPASTQQAVYDAYQSISVEQELERKSAREVIVEAGADTPQSRKRRQTRASNVESQMEELGIDDIAFIENFPITNAVFGYTRINREPTDSRLMAFQEEQVSSSGEGTPVFADTVETEAVQFSLDPEATFRWLLTNANEEDELNARLLDAMLASDMPADREFPRPDEWEMERLNGWLDGRSHELSQTEPLSEWTRNDVRAWFMNNVGSIPEIEAMTVDADTDDEEVIAYVVYHLVHSYCHLILKQVSHLSGMSRTSLAEYILPRSLSFVIYSNQRTDFNIGAMFTLVESSLDDLFSEVEQRGNDCVYDPVCSRDGSSCHDCMYLSEVSCSHLNRNLGRDFVFGSKPLSDRSLRGYLTAVR